MARSLYCYEHAVARADLTLLTPLTVRAARIERMLRRGVASFARLQDLAGGSRASVKRDLALLRRMGAIVVYDAFDNGYRLRNPDWPGVRSFVAEELGRWA